MNTTPYRGFRFPKAIIQHAIWLYLRFTLSLRDVEELLAERGIVVTYETVRVWVARFGPLIARRLRRRRGRPSNIWHLDEMFVKIGGGQMYCGGRSTARARSSTCWSRAGETSGGPAAAAQAAEDAGHGAEELVTDRLRAYGAAARELGLSAEHIQAKRKNNRAESSHVPIRRRERKMQGFRSPGSAQRFLAAHAAVANTFTTCRHLISAGTIASFEPRPSPHGARQRSLQREHLLSRAPGGTFVIKLTMPCRSFLAGLSGSRAPAPIVVGTIARVVEDRLVLPLVVGAAEGEGA